MSGPLSVLADRVQLHQVIANLVKNAIEAMDAVDERSRTLRVKSAVSDPEVALITVEDSGPGLIRKTWNAFSTRTSLQRRRVWEWDCRFAGPLSNRMMGDFLHVRMQIEDRYFRLNYPRLGTLRTPNDEPSRPGLDRGCAAGRRDRTATAARTWRLHTSTRINPAEEEQEVRVVGLTRLPWAAHKDRACPSG